MTIEEFLDELKVMRQAGWRASYICHYQAIRLDPPKNGHGTPATCSTIAAVYYHRFRETMENLQCLSQTKLDRLSLSLKDAQEISRAEDRAPNYDPELRNRLINALLTVE